MSDRSSYPVGPRVPRRESLGISNRPTVSAGLARLEKIGMTKRKTPSAGVKADDRPGTQLLQQLLNYFSHDRTPIYRSDKTVGQLGAPDAQKALEFLEAGDAQHAVEWTVKAMLHYCTMEKHELTRENALDMQGVAEWWEKDTEPAVKREIARRKGKDRQAADFQRRLDDAGERLAELLNSRGRMSPSEMVRKAAKKAGISERAFRKHMPEHLKHRQRVWHR